MKTQLRLKLENQRGQTVLGERYFTSPLKLGTPNMDGKRLWVVLMMASAGILKGDCFDYDIACAPDTKTVLTEQSYNKIFDTGDGGAKKKIHISVGTGASLYYRPCAVIPFAGSSFDGTMTVDLDEKSEFIYTDIFAAGRIGMGEKFAFRHYRNRCSVRVLGRLVWFEHCLYEPEQMDLAQMMFFDTYTHAGTFYYYGNKQIEEKLYDFFSRDESKEKQEELLCAASHALCGICIRILGYTAQDIEEKFMQIEKIINATSGC